MKEIKLTRGMVALVDDEDFERINAHKWYAHKAHHGAFYAARKVWDTKKHIAMHREIIGAPDGKEVDHINADTLDNRRSNLRLCTTVENFHNRGKYANNTSGYKGVYWNIRHQKWYALIGLNSKLIYIGCFGQDKEAAAHAYDEAARKYHGEFARTNFK